MDASFVVHPDLKSRTGGAMMYGQGPVIIVSKPQKWNTKSNTKFEWVGAANIAIIIMLWLKLLLKKQGSKIWNNILYQYKKSTILWANTASRV